jgi:hypothetical protein
MTDTIARASFNFPQNKARREAEERERYERLYDNLLYVYDGNHDAVDAHLELLAEQRGEARARLSSGDYDDLDYDDDEGESS